MWNQEKLSVSIDRLYEGNIRDQFGFKIWS